MNVRSGSRDVWILDNKLHHNSADGIQFCHGCSENPPQFVGSSPDCVGSFIFWRLPGKDRGHLNENRLQPESALYF
jgi:hypothetical protein